MLMLSILPHVTAAGALTPPATLSAAIAPAWSGTVTDGASSFAWSTSAKSAGTYKRLGGSANFDATRYSTDAARGVDADCRHGARAARRRSHPRRNRVPWRCPARSELAARRSADPALDCFCTTLSPFAVYPGVLAFTDGKVKGAVADQMRYSHTSAGINTYTLPR